jgi:hypothetical protein
MKKALGVLFLFSIFLVSTSFAETPDLTGTWKGKGAGMLPNGYVIDGLVLTAKITNQVGGLFSATFVVKVPGMGKTALSGVGYVGPDGKLKAIWNFEGQVVGIAEAWVDTSQEKWTMEGVGSDFSDGSINAFKLIKKK